MKRVFHDLRTGHEVWQMTEGECSSYATYPYRQAFSADEKYAVFSSELTGQLEVHRLEIETGETTQLSHGLEAHDLNLSLSVDPLGREALYLDGQVVRGTDLLTGRTRVVMDTSELEEFERPNGFSFATDGALLLTYQRRDGHYAIALGNLNGANPREIKVFPAALERITHALLCPTKSSIATYNRLPDGQNQSDAPREVRARTWKLDLRTGEDEPFLVMPSGYRATHEFWSPDGSRLFFHKKHCQNWTPASIGSIPRGGGEQTIHYTDEHRLLGHSSINARQTKIVSDNQALHENELLLIDLKSGEAETLCWPNASGRGHPNHIHPSFSPSGHKIIYTSDSTGWAQVYILPFVSGKWL